MFDEKVEAKENMAFIKLWDVPQTSKSFAARFEIRCNTEASDEFNILKDPVNDVCQAAGSALIWLPSDLHNLFLLNGEFE